MNRTLLTERQKGRVAVVVVVAVGMLVTILQMKAIYGEREGRQTLAPTSSRPQWTPLPDTEMVEILMEGPLNATDPRLLEWLRTGAGSRFFKPSTLPYNTTFNNIGRFRDSTVYKFYVNMINKYLSSKVGGVFLEAGALDGYLLSTTLMLEKDRAWSGVLVEPRPDMFQEMLQKQRKAYAARFCLAEKPYPYKTKFWLSPDYVKESIAYGAVGSKVFDKVPMLAVERKDKGKEDQKAFIRMIESNGFKLIGSLQEDFVFLRKDAIFLVPE